jgi:hypothetical protein
MHLEQLPNSKTMDVLLAREQPQFWDPNHVDRAPLCDVVKIDDSKLPPSLHAFAPERFVPYGALAGRCPASVDALADPKRPMAEGRSALAAAWSRLADGVIIISLREAAGRRARLAEELRMAGFLPENEAMVLWYIADRPRKDFDGSRGRFGCMRSHVAVTVEAERRGWKRWVVFEDDAIFPAEVSAGAVHNAADAMDADPEMAVLALGTSLVICDEESKHEARNVFPVKIGGGTTCMVTTPIYTRALAPLRGVYGDPEEKREATYDEVDTTAPASDHVIFVSNYVRKFGGVYQVLPNIVYQAGATTIGYETLSLASFGSWAANTFGLNRMLKKIAHPHVRTAVSATAYAMSIGVFIALIVAAVYVYLRAKERHRKRKATANTV